MDIREKKTIRSIQNAFLQLRARKPIEKITIKELAELAEISKATFYLHYKDIYDLSAALEQQVISDVIKSIGEPEPILSDPAAFTTALYTAIFEQENLINTLFSGSRANILPESIETQLRQYIIQRYPQLDKNPFFCTSLTYRVYGAFFAYQKNRKACNTADILKAITMLSESPESFKNALDTYRLL